VDGGGSSFRATQNYFYYKKKFNCHFYSEVAAKEGPPNEAHDGEDYD